jgi:hypothetical protein
LGDEQEPNGQVLVDSQGSTASKGAIMRVTLLLADAAQAIDNKLYILGGGWSVTGPAASPFAIAMKFEVPWDQTNTKHEFRLELLTQDGQPVAQQGAAGPVVIGGAFEVGRPTGLAEGTPIDFALAINSGPMPLPPGGRYVWKLFIDGEPNEDWQLGFTTRPA